MIENRELSTNHSERISKIPVDVSAIYPNVTPHYAPIEVHPASQSARVISNPKPLAPPVITAVFPWSLCYVRLVCVFSKITK